MGNILLEALDAEQERRELEAEAQRLTGSLYEFIVAAWPLVIPFALLPAPSLKKQAGTWCE